jgi:16S rRNA (cytosine967-C5)-methyltransferase
VRPDGILVYATCSLEEEENGGQVDAFLEAHPEFEPAPGGDVDASCLDAARRLFVRPQEHGTDGAFAARMRRTRV